MLHAFRVGARGRAWRGGALAAAFTLSFGVGVGALATALSSSPAAAQGSDLYAYAQGTGSPSGCPSESDPATGCSFGEALGQAGPGDYILLATPGSSQAYVGNWTVSTAGTSPSTPVTIEPAPGVSDPTVSGNGGSATGCTTGSCDGTILQLAGGVSLTIEGLTIEDAYDEISSFGGAIDTGTGTAGGTVKISDSSFVDDQIASFPGDGGAIDNGDGGSGTVSVSDSSFVDDFANSDGGAIDNGDGGSGTVSVSDSTFTSDTAALGGAIDNDGSGSVSVSGSTFTGDSAYLEDGGAIANGDLATNGSTSVTDSTFSDDTAALDGGAIDNAYDYGSGTLSVSDSTFSDDSAGGDGDVIDNSDSGGSGTVYVAGDIFSGSCYRAGGTWDDEGYNVGSDDTCFSGSPSGDTADSSISSELGSLSWNGGTTETILPLGSGPADPAIGLVPNDTMVDLNGASVTLCPTADERGASSVPGQSCDAGAVQDASPALSIAAQSQTVPFATAPDLTADYNGFILGQGPSSLAIEATCQVDREGTTKPVTKSPIRPGTYTINCSGADNSSADTQNDPDTNYSISYNPATLVVKEPKVPVNTVLPTISGSLGSGETVMRVPGHWVGPEPLTFGFHWDRCSGPSPSDGCRAIPGADNPYEYTLTDSDVGHYVTVFVTATDPAGRHGYATAIPVGPVTRSDVIGKG